MLASIVSHGSTNSPILVEGAMEVVTGALLKAAGPAEAQQVHALLAQPVHSLLMHHDDPGVLQNCTHYLRSDCLSSLLRAACMSAVFCVVST